MCEIRRDLHQNFADILTNDVGVDVITQFVQILSEICMDPEAHNAIVVLLDVFTANLTDPDVAESVGNLMYWTRKVMMNPNFRLSLHETMVGVNRLFDKVDELQPVLDALFRNVNRMIDDPVFDSNIQSFAKNFSTVVNMHKTVLYNAGLMLVKPLSAMRSSRTTGAQDQRKVTRSNSNKY